MEFVGTPVQMVKALVMAQLLGEHFSKWGRCADADVDRASEIADRVVKAASEPAKVPQAPPIQNPGYPSLESQMIASMRQFGNAQMPAMPNPVGNPAHIVPPVPNTTQSPEGTVLDLSKPHEVG